MKNKLAKNFSLLFFDKISKFLIVLVSTTLVSRYLGPEDFGRLSYAIVVSSFLTFAIQQGLEQLIIRHLAQIKSAAEQSQFIGAMIGYKIIFGIAGFFIYWIFSVKLGDNPCKLKFPSNLKGLYKFCRNSKRPNFKNWESIVNGYINPPDISEEVKSVLESTKVPYEVAYNAMREISETEAIKLILTNQTKYLED